MTCTLESETDTQPKLADGTPFTLGMTVFLPGGGIEGDGPIRCIETDPATHELRRFVHDGDIYNCLTSSDEDFGDVSFMHTSRESILDLRIAQAEREIAAATARLERFQIERKLGS